jgi:hypothetical protein
MVEHQGVHFDIEHPAPHRERVPLRLLLFGLSGGALAWALQLATNSAIAGVACLAGGGERPWAPRWEWAEPASMAINLGALLLAFLALAVASLSIRKTRHEEAERSGDVMDAGEGRTRFLSVWGIWASLLFILAIGFNTISLLWSGLCAP